MEMVKISLERYEELIDLETRVNVAVERMTNATSCNLKDVLCILGTKEALKRVDKIKEEEKKLEKSFQTFINAGEREEKKE